MSEWQPTLQIRTVDELVAHLRRKRIKFYVDDCGCIRALGTFDIDRHHACPLAAPLPYRERDNNFASERAEDAYGFPFSLGSDVIAAADNETDHDPAIRAKLLELVS